MLELSEDEIFKKIDKTEQLSREIIKMDNNLFCFPYGESDEGEHTTEAYDLSIPILLEKEYKMVSASDILNAVPLYRHKLKKLKATIYENRHCT